MKFEAPADALIPCNYATTLSATNPSVTCPNRTPSLAGPETPQNPPLVVVAARLRHHFDEIGEPFASLAEDVVLDIAAVLMTTHCFRLGGHT